MRLSKRKKKKRDAMFYDIRNKEHSQTYCASKYGYTSQVYIPTSRHSVPPTNEGIYPSFINSAGC